MERTTRGEGAGREMRGMRWRVWEARLTSSSIAEPKSITFTAFGSAACSMMFSSLRSRCTMPLENMCATALASLETKGHAAPAERRVERRGEHEGPLYAEPFEG